MNMPCARRPGGAWCARKSGDVAPPVRTRDEGSILVVVLLFFVVSLLMVMGTVAASSAFIAQRNLASACDSAALAAAGEVDLEGVYRGGLEGLLTLDPVAAQRAVAAVVAAQRALDPDLSMSVRTDSTRVVVTCRTRASLPFGAAFGYPQGLPRTAVSAAQIPAQ